MKRGRVVLVVVAVLAVVALAALGRVGYVRTAYGEWGLNPSDAPPRLAFGGRDYHRGGPVDAVPVGDVLVGHVGGGDLYGPPDRTYAPTVLVLRTSGGVTDYSLAGGP